MILQALTRYYEILASDGRLPKPGYSTAKVSFALNLSESGELLEIFPLKKEEQRGKKIIEVPQKKVVPEQAVRSVGISANFLCDNSSYFFGARQKRKTGTFASVLCCQPQTARNNFTGCTYPGGKGCTRLFLFMGSR